MYQLKNLSPFLKDKKNVLILIIVIIFLFVIFVLPIFRVGTSEQIDHTNKIIYFGQTCDLTNNQVSKDYSRGFNLAFSYANRKGGINGYKIKIILLNDMYEIDAATKNAKLLIDYYNVLGIVGTFGTPTTVGIITDAINDRLVPLIAPFSAGTSYRDTFIENIVTTNTSYIPEFDLITENMIQNSFTNISIIFQNDIYGNAFYNAFVDYSLKNTLPFNIVSSGKYERNSDDLDGTFKSVFNVDNPYDFSGYNITKIMKIQAVVLFTSEKEISTFLGVLKKINPSIAIYYNFFVGTSKTNVELLKYGNKDNIYQTLLSYPTLDNYPELNNILNNEVAEYNKTDVIKINGLTSSIIQGFYSGMMINKVLENFKDMREINRKSLMEMFYKMRTIDVYGFPMGPFEFGKNNEAIKYATLNKLQSNLEFKIIKQVNYNQN